MYLGEEAAHGVLDIQVHPTHQAPPGKFFFCLISKKKKIL